MDAFQKHDMGRGIGAVRSALNTSGQSFPFGGWRRLERPRHAHGVCKRSPAALSGMQCE